jgi:hypothetical protein
LEYRNNILIFLFYRRIHDADGAPGRLGAGRQRGFTRRHRDRRAERELSTVGTPNAAPTKPASATSARTLRWRSRESLLGRRHSSARLVRAVADARGAAGERRGAGRPLTG